jgi:hypothetical protein
VDPCAEPGPRRRGGHETGRSTGTAVGTRALVEPPAAARVAGQEALVVRHQDGRCNRHGRAGEREDCELSKRLIGESRSTRSTSDVGKSQFGNRIRPVMPLVARLRGCAGLTRSDSFSSLATTQARHLGLQSSNLPF